MDPIVENLTKEKQSLQAELACLEKERLASRRREDALKTALEKSEAQVKTLSDKGAKYVALQSKVEDLEKVHAEGKKRHQAELDALQNQITHAKKLHAEQKAKIERLSSQADSLATVVKGLKLSVKHAQNDTEEVKSQLKSVEKEKTAALAKIAESAQSELRRKADDRNRNSRIIDLEKQLSESLARNKATEARCKDLESRLQSASHESESNVAKLRVIQSEASRHGSDAKALQQRVMESDAQKKSLEQSLQSRDEELATVRDMLVRCSQAYGHLYSSTVQTSLHDQAKRENYQLRFTVARLERKLADREAQVQELADLIRQYALEKQLLANAVDQAYQDCEDRLGGYKSALKDIYGHLRERSGRDGIEDLQELQLRMTQQSHDATCSDLQYYRLLSDHYYEESESLRLSYLSLETTYGEAIAAVKAHDVVATNLQATQAKLLDDNKHLRISANNTADELKICKAELQEARTELSALRVKFNSVEDELRKDVQKAETALSEELLRVKDLNNAAIQFQAREQGYKDDINTLVEQVEDLGRFEKAYHDLMKEVNILVSRNALAEHDADHLSQMNAEILSHTNPGQKIFYVDKIRRDLAETKQNLITVTCELKETQDLAAALTSELASYKSITLAADPKQSTRLTRVQRVPFGERNGTIGQGARGVTKSLKEGTLLQQQRMTLSELGL
ncbi:hypothetical protein FRC03_007610 [Tulasnella sp. 419]|nr:hypothetical protein FRC03_007610 [Tulasnella sp. 419]